MEKRTFNSYGFNNLVKQPCTKDCPERSIGCHSRCEKYIKFNELNTSKRDELNRYKNADRVLKSYNPSKRNMSIRSKRDR